MNHQDFDVVIVGAGLSGIGAAYHRQTKCPGKSSTPHDPAGAGGLDLTLEAIPAPASVRRDGGAAMTRSAQPNGESAP